MDYAKRPDEPFSVARLRLWLFLAFLPAVIMLMAAFLVAADQHDRQQMAQVARTARLSAAAIDLRLGKLLEVTQYCSTAPDLLERVNLTAYRKNCGRYADLIGAWVVVTEIGSMHRQILNTLPERREPLPAYPRGDERPELLALEAESGVSGRPALSDVFTGIVHKAGVVAGGQRVRLADGRDAMVYVNLSVRDLSEQLIELAADEEQVLALVDPSRRIVARSTRIEQAIFKAIPLWFVGPFESGRQGAALGVPGPQAIGGTWDAGYHPLGVAPGWMAVAVKPASGWVGTWRLISVPSGLALSGLVLSGMLIAFAAYHERNRARVAATERARVAAEQRSTEKSRLLASFAHDIRSPLISLVGSLELPDRASDSRIRAALHSAESLLQLVDDILELTFVGSGAFVLHPSPVDLRRLVQGLADQVRSLADRKGLALLLDLDPALPPVVEVDRLRLQQVLSNLLTNAVKYTQAGSVTLRIQVKAMAGGRATLAFAVVDTGIGLAPEDIPGILEEYVRLDREAERREHGTGLGLAIVQQVLGAMGAALSIESVPDQGSTFGFTLTLQVLADKDACETGQPLAGMTILYVEDEPVIRQVTSRRLTGAGALVIEAVDGSEALARLKDLAPDILLLDLQMPVLDGLGVVRQLRAGASPPRFPVFVLTAHIAGPQAAEAKAAGADVILTKPVQIEPLAAAFDAWRRNEGLHGAAIGAAPAPGAGALVDIENLSAVFGMLDPAASAALLVKFETGLRQDLAALDAAIARDDAAEIGRKAHRCLGLCQVMGAVALAARLQEIEARAKAGQIQSIATLAADWPRLVHETLARMRVVLADAGNPASPGHDVVP